MSAVDTTIRVNRSSIVANSDSFRRKFRWPQKKNPNDRNLVSLKATQQVRNPVLRICSRKVVANQKMCSCSITHELHVLVHAYSKKWILPRKVELLPWKNKKFLYGLISSNLSWCSKSPHSFGYYLCLAHRPPNGYYYHDFQRLDGIFNSTFYGDL
ncbi:hypothetical protein TNCV_3874541 [Trichonephila clavipes]|nr:hypothetical protein TNCV_3874541 [Trichonephila clavipes]